MKLRSVNQVISAFRRYISSIDPKLSLFPAYGNLYIIFRAISSIITSQEYTFLEEINKYRLSKAKGEILDQLGKEFGLTRLLGSKASGGVLISGATQYIRKGTILVNVTQDLEYEITSNIRLVNNIETMAPVISLIKSSRANLREGTYLYSRAYPNHKFIVGTFRNFNNEISGPIIGGLDKESDSDFRARIIGKLNGSINPSSHINIFTTLKSLEYVGDLFIREHWPVPGIVTIYSNIKDKMLLEDLNKTLYTMRPLGVSIIHRPILRYSVDVEIRVDIDRDQSIDRVDSYLDSEVHNYFSSMSIGETLNRSKLQSALSGNNLIKSLLILKPESDVRVVQDVLLVPGKIRKSFHEI